MTHKLQGHNAVRSYSQQCTRDWIWFQ